MTLRRISPAQASKNSMLIAGSPTISKPHRRSYRSRAGEAARQTSTVSTTHVDASGNGVGESNSDERARHSSANGRSHGGPPRHRLRTLHIAGGGIAYYVLLQAHLAQTNGQLDDFNKVAIAALITVIGTGLTGLAAVYSATRQSTTAYQVAQYGGAISENLARMRERTDAELALLKGKLDLSLAELKAASDESLTRLKVALDAGQNANRELFGTVAVYFHALRSAARGTWDDDSLRASETSMIFATRHLIHVDEGLRNQWFDFWQRAQDIHHAAAQEPDANKRQALVSHLIGNKVQTVSGKVDLRELYDQLETTARNATKAEGVQLEGATQTGAGD